MSLHPAIEAALEQAAALPPMHTLPLETVRAGFVARYAAIPRPDVGHVEDRTIPGPRGQIRLRIYRPELAGTRPVVAFFHGGGFAICSIETHDGPCRQICLRADAVVVSVDYALAPEHKFPAGPDDCLAAARWIGAHAGEFGGDPEKLVLMGDSAGGTLAAVTAIRLRDEGGPKPAAQILLYPVTDYHTPGTPSYAQRGEGFGLTRDAMKWFWGHYLQEASHAAHPHASPLHADDLAGLPPAYVVTAEYDPLRDEGERFAQRLTQAGVPTTLIRYADMNHGFMSWVGIIDRSGEALDAACAWLRKTTG
jgi:acetyl esterase